MQIQSKYGSTSKELVSLSVFLIPLIYLCISSTYYIQQQQQTKPCPTRWGWPPTYYIIECFYFCYCSLVSLATLFYNYLLFLICLTISLMAHGVFFLCVCACVVAVSQKVPFRVNFGTIIWLIWVILTLSTAGGT